MKTVSISKGNSEIRENLIYQWNSQRYELCQDFSKEDFLLNFTFLLVCWAPKISILSKIDGQTAINWVWFSVNIDNR